MLRCRILSYWVMCVYCMLKVNPSGWKWITHLAPLFFRHVLNPSGRTKERCAHLTQLISNDTKTPVQSSWILTLSSCWGFEPSMRATYWKSGGALATDQSGNTCFGPYVNTYRLNSGYTNVIQNSWIHLPSLLLLCRECTSPANNTNLDQKSYLIV